jgi:hypothetical protein
MEARMVSQVNPRLRESIRAATVWQLAEVQAVARKIDAAFKKHERQLFSSEGAFGGMKWAPLAPATLRAKAGLQLGTRIKSRRAIFASKKIMQRTGLLRKSLSQGGLLHVLNLGAVPRAFVEFGTAVDYAAHHIIGPHNKRQPKHERDVMQHRPEQERKYTDIATEYTVQVKAKRAAKILLAWRKQQRAQLRGFRK